MTAAIEYPVCLHPLSTEDGGGWVAIVPDLPGCMADGESAFEALQNVSSAIDEWKDAASAMGRSIPTPDPYRRDPLSTDDPMLPDVDSKRPSRDRKSVKT